MKLGRSLGNIPQKLNELVLKTRYISDCQSISVSINCTLENRLTFRNISSFYNEFFSCGTLPSDPSNCIKK
jgi:hypothetical protein